MWEMVGDPLMRVPRWFSESNVIPDAPSSLGPPEFVNGGYTINLTPALTFTQSDDNASDTLAFQIQIDDAPDFLSPVVDYTSGELPQGSASFTVGQSAAGGTYDVGGSGRQLPGGAYWWRVRSFDWSIGGPWAQAGAASPAFIIGEP